MPPLVAWQYQRQAAPGSPEAELTELLTFYRSPVGRKLVERRQQMLDEGMRGIQTWSAQFAREMEVKVREEMKKRGFTI